MIYFMQAGDEPVVKIGQTADVAGRLRDLQGAHWRELRVIRFADGALREEQWLHRYFAAQRIRFEWFHLTPEMLTIDLTNIVGFPQPMNHVAAVIEKFGGTRAMAAKLGILPGSVQHWKRTGRIPAARQRLVLETAREHDIKIEPAELVEPLRRAG